MTDHACASSPGTTDPWAKVENELHTLRQDIHADGGSYYEYEHYEIGGKCYAWCDKLEHITDAIDTARAEAARLHQEELTEQASAHTSYVAALRKGLLDKLQTATARAEAAEADVQRLTEQLNEKGQRCQK